jgi:hypothetical protein
VEEVSLEPHIVLVHQLMTNNQIRAVIRTVAPKLQSTKGGPSMSFKQSVCVCTVQSISSPSFDLSYLKEFSFKHLFTLTCSTTLEETEHQMPFIRHLERALGVKAAPGVDSDFSVVSRYLAKYALR